MAMRLGKWMRSALGLGEISMRDIKIAMRLGRMLGNVCVRVSRLLMNLDLWINLLSTAIAEPMIDVVESIRTRSLSPMLNESCGCG